MRNRRHFAWSLALLLLGSTGCWVIAQSSLHKVSRDALVAEVAGRVKVLAFTTGRPVSDVRVLVDGKQVDSTEFHGGETGLKLAVVAPSSSQQVEIYVEVPHEARILKAGYRMRTEANVGESQYFGPGTNLVLQGWTQVYGLS